MNSKPVKKRSRKIIQRPERNENLNFKMRLKDGQLLDQRFDTQQFTKSGTKDYLDIDRVIREEMISGIPQKKFEMYNEFAFPSHCNIIETLQKVIQKNNRSHNEKSTEGPNQSQRKMSISYILNPI